MGGGSMYDTGMSAVGAVSAGACYSCALHLGASPAVAVALAVILGAIPQWAALWLRSRRERRKADEDGASDEG